MFAMRQILLGPRGGGGGLPSGYTEVNYITPASSGAYIDLGWHPTTWTAFEAYNMTVGARGVANFGVADSSGANAGASLISGFSLYQNWANDRWLGFHQSGTYIFNNYGTAYNIYSDLRANTHSHAVDIEKYIHRAEGNVTSEYSIDGTAVETDSFSGVVPSSVQSYSYISNNIYLFALNVNGTAKRTGITKMGRLRFYTMDGDVANFIPCLDPDNNAGMYDLVSRTFYGASSGTINYGSIV